MMNQDISPHTIPQTIAVHLIPGALNDSILFSNRATDHPRWLSSLDEPASISEVEA